MESADQYRQRLQSLQSLPEPEASEALRQALLKGTRSGGLTFTRATIFHYFEHVHHYFGCPEDDPCDKDIQKEPLCWEKALMIPVKHIIDENAECDALVANLMVWSTLCGIMVYLEDEIRTRWLKKSKAQRKAILEKAWPSQLPKNHRPDIDRSFLMRARTRGIRMAWRSTPFPISTLRISPSRIRCSSFLTHVADTQCGNSPFWITSWLLWFIYDQHFSRRQSTLCS